MNKEKAQYIDKDALVAKIERRFDECSSSILKHYDACKEAKALELGKILTIIDTLEVIEVDLEKHLKEDIEDAVHGTVDYPLIGCDFPNIFPNYKELKEYCDRNGIKDNDKVKLIIIKDV